MASYDPSEMLEWMRTHFIVSPTLGTLTWIKPPKTHPRLYGKNAGGPRHSHTGKLYWIIRRNGASLRRSWLIFLWVNGRWPTPMIDHKDGNSENDIATNLRDADVFQNAQNHKGRRKKEDTPMGVRCTESGRFCARIANRKRYITIGTFTTIEKAQAAYMAKRKELFGEFA